MHEEDKIKTVITARDFKSPHWWQDPQFVEPTYGQVLNTFQVLLSSKLVRNVCELLLILELAKFYYHQN